MPLMGVNPNRIFLITSALGGGLAGLAACLLVLQYDIHPAIGLSFGPITFLVCVLGGLGNMIGGFIAAFIFAQFISVGGFFLHIESKDPKFDVASVQEFLSGLGAVDTEIIQDLGHAE